MCCDWQKDRSDCVPQLNSLYTQQDVANKGDAKLSLLRNVDMIGRSHCSSIVLLDCLCRRVWNITESTLANVASYALTVTAP
jgi:hypothetical protein